jgi:quercetin dioxygenase-like cupin family protein
MHCKKQTMAARRGRPRRLAVAIQGPEWPAAVVGACGATQLLSPNRSISVQMRDAGADISSWPAACCKRLNRSEHWNVPCFINVSSSAQECIHMLNKTSMTFSHVKPGDTDFKGEGLRDFFLYRDLGVGEATAGKVLAQLVKANAAPEKGTGWHQHGAEFHIVYMLKGWARFMYEDKETLVEAGDCVHQRPGIVHFLFDYSPDMEYLEVVGPVDFTTKDAQGPCEVPAPEPWR